MGEAGTWVGTKAPHLPGRHESCPAGMCSAPRGEGLTHYLALLRPAAAWSLCCELVPSPGAICREGLGLAGLC